MTLDSSFQKTEPNKSQRLQAEGGTANQRLKYVSNKKRKSTRVNGIKILTTNISNIIIILQRSQDTKN